MDRRGMDRKELKMHSPIFLPQLPRNAVAWYNRYSVNLLSTLPLRYQIINIKNIIHNT